MLILAKGSLCTSGNLIAIASTIAAALLIAGLIGYEFGKAKVPVETLILRDHLRITQDRLAEAVKLLREIECRSRIPTEKS